MKRLKEFFWFLIPFLCLCGLSILLNPGLLIIFSSEKLNSIAKAATIMSFVTPFFLSLTVAVIYKIFVFIKKDNISRKNKFLTVFFLSEITTAVWLIDLVKSVDAKPIEAMDFVLGAILVLQIGVSVTFFFWIAELIYVAIKKIFVQ